MAGLSYLRFAAGVCVLTACLLIGGVGGAVAVADPDAGGSTAHGDDGTNGSRQQHSASAKKPKDERGGADTEDGARGSGGDSGQQPSSGAKNPKNPKDEPGDTDSTDETNAGLAAAAPAAVAPVASAPAAVASAPAAVASAPAAVATVPASVASAPAAVASAPAPVAVPAAVASAPAAVAPVPAAVAPVPNLVAPVSDGITGVEPVVDAGGRIDSAALSAAVNAWVASELPQLWAFAGIPGMPVADIATEVAPLGGIAASISAAMTQVGGGASSLPGLAQSFFRAASSELLLTGTGSLSGLAAPSGGVAGLMILNAAGVLPISLAALAALALPGAGGLTILTAAGVRVGYRQAKAGSAVRAAGIARFAGPGPLGVVHSGSLIVVRPRALRVARARASSGRFDKVA